MIYNLSKNLFKLIFRIFFRFRIEGHECIPKEVPFILASNHISYLDHPVVGSGCPRPLYYLAKQELFNHRLFRWWLLHAHAFPVKRGASDIKAIRQALSILRDRPLLLFPQGTRGADALLPGVGFLHRKSKAPIVAARVRGTDKILPRGATCFRFGRISVRYALVDTITEDDSDEMVARKVMDKINSL